MTGPGTPPVVDALVVLADYATTATSTQPVLLTIDHRRCTWYHVFETLEAPLGEQLALALQHNLEGCKV